MAKSRNDPAAVEAYLATLPGGERETLQKLRALDANLSAASREPTTHMSRFLTKAARCFPVSVDLAATRSAGVPSNTTRPAVLQVDRPSGLARSSAGLYAVGFRRIAAIHIRLIRHEIARGFDVIRTRMTSRVTEVLDNGGRRATILEATNELHSP